MPIKIERTQKSGGISADEQSCSNPEIHSKSSSGGEDVPVTTVHANDTVNRHGHETDKSYIDKETAVNYVENRAGENNSHKSQVGALWDVFHRKDVPLLIEYIRNHWNELGRADNIFNDNVIYFSCFSILKLIPYKDHMIVFVANIPFYFRYPSLFMMVQYI